MAHGDGVDPVVSPSDVTAMLEAASGGDVSAAGRLMPLVYEQLRRQAQVLMSAERSAGAGHTLSATALVHEAYLRLAGPRELPWQSRAHFYASAAQAMRRILVDHARAKGARGGAKVCVSDIPDLAALVNRNPEEILAVEAALARLEQEDADAAEVIRLRFYAGLSVDRTAEAMNVSPRQAARLWSYARAKLMTILDAS
jgi:RNA polymerase sigma-70 factor, ECF subfamily